MKINKFYITPLVDSPEENTDGVLITIENLDNHKESLNLMQNLINHMDTLSKYVSIGGMCEVSYEEKYKKNH